MGFTVAASKLRQTFTLNWADGLRLSGLLKGNSFVWLSLLVYRYSGYYSSTLSPWTQRVMLYLAIGYSLYSIYFYLRMPRQRLLQANARLALSGIKKIISGLLRFIKTGPRDYTNPIATLAPTEKRALLFGAVKLFFIPIMINFLYDNYHGFVTNLDTFGSAGSLFSVTGFNNVMYPLLFTLFLLIDTAFFAFGYLFESNFLSNKVRSVEPTALGWAVALICYPPFNGTLNGYTSWYANDYPVFSSEVWTMLIRLAVLVLMAFYASASVALGPKASNLTNRGIVGYGPYRIVRHPAYVSKNLAWWLSLLPVLSLAAIISMAFWSVVYFMRAITEERHLSADPDYVSYCRRVKHRFIPGVI